MPSLSRATSDSSTSTLQRIPTSQLRPGMLQVRILDSWWKSPFFVHRRVLKSSTDVQQFMSAGIREVEIDTSLGVAVSSQAESGGAEAASPSEGVGSLNVSCDLDASVSKEERAGSFGPESKPDSAPPSEEDKNREEVVQ